MISIIINCYNGEKFLEEALHSIKSQTYTNWEVIFWDNMSNDNSALIYKSFDDKRFRYYLSSEHDLLYAARNKAIKKAKGNFIAFLDVDDFWHPKKLEKQILLFHDKEVGAVYSNFWFKDEEKKIIKKFSNFKLPSGYIKDSLIKKYQVGLLTLMIRKEAFSNTGFNNKFHIIGDFDLCIKLSLKWKFAVINECLATYRWHGNNESIKNVLLQAEELKIWQKNLFKHLTKNNLKHINDKILRIHFNYELKLKQYRKCFNEIHQMNLYRNKIKSFIQIIIFFIRG